MEREVFVAHGKIQPNASLPAQAAAADSLYLDKHGKPNNQTPALSARSRLAREMMDTESDR